MADAIWNNRYILVDSQNRPCLLYRELQTQQRSKSNHNEEEKK